LDIVFKKCVIRCPNEVLEELQRLSVDGVQAGSGAVREEDEKTRKIFEMLVRGDFEGIRRLIEQRKS